MPRRIRPVPKKEGKIKEATDDSPGWCFFNGGKENGRFRSRKKEILKENRGCAIFLFWRHFLKGPGYCLLFPAECKRIFVVQQCKGSKHLPRNAACVATKKFLFKPKKEGRPKVARLSLWPRPLQKRWAAHTGRKKQNWQFLDEELLFSLLYLAFKLPSIFCQQKKVKCFFSPSKKSKMQNSCTSKSFFVPCEHQVCHLRRG